MSEKSRKGFIRNKASLSFGSTPIVLAVAFPAVAPDIDAAPKKMSVIRRYGKAIRVSIEQHGLGFVSRSEIVELHTISTRGE